MCLCACLGARSAPFLGFSRAGPLFRPLTWNPCGMNRMGLPLAYVMPFVRVWKRGILWSQAALQGRGEAGEGHLVRRKGSPVLQVCAAQPLCAGLSDSSLCFLLCHMLLCGTLQHSRALCRCWDCLVILGRSGQGGEGSSISLSYLERLKVFL